MNDQQHSDHEQLPTDDTVNRPLPGLGPLESAIMLTLWDTPQPLKVTEVTERLAYPRELAYTTVMTVLTILCRKHLACRHRTGRAWLYAPTLSHDDYLTQRVRDLITHAEDPEAVLRNALAEPEHCGV
jgi:predicted transcriptional regulator